MNSNLNLDSLKKPKSKVKVCQKCVNDSSVPQITFSSNGICNYCSYYDKIQSTITDYDLLKTLWLKRIEKYKGMGEYDALVGFSGGKDSSYILYQLKNKYKLKIKAWTLDNGFLTKKSKERINEIIDQLGIDYEYRSINRNTLSELYNISISFQGGPCLTCSLILYPLMVKTASEQLIPMAIHGRSRPQMFQVYSADNHLDALNPFLEMGLSKVEDINTVDVMRNSIKRLLNIIPKERFEAKFKLFFPVYEKKSFISEFIGYFLYHPYNEKKLIQFLKKNLNWKTYENSDILQHFDCEAHDAASYLYEIAYGRPFIMPEVSVYVRENILTRKEALERLERELFKNKPEESFEILSKFVNRSAESLIENAKQIAKRNFS